MTAVYLSIALAFPPDIFHALGATHVAIALPQSSTLPGLLITSGLNVHKLATPTIALMTNLATICGTNLNTMMVDSSPKTTTVTGVSRAVPDRKSSLGAEGDTQRRSESLLRKALSDSTTGVCLVIQER